jgi:hypothetical protein
LVLGLTRVFYDGLEDSGRKFTPSSGDNEERTFQGTRSRDRLASSQRTFDQARKGLGGVRGDAEEEVGINGRVIGVESISSGGDRLGHSGGEQVVQGCRIAGALETVLWELECVDKMINKILVIGIEWVAVRGSFPVDG